MFVSFIAKFYSVFLAVLMFFTTPINLIIGKKTEAIKVKNDGCLLSFAAISDTHLDEKTPTISQSTLEAGLSDMSRAKDRLDAVVFDGDLTNHGYFTQWDMFASSLAKFDVADNLLLVAGNHDTWGPNRDDFTNPVDGVLPTFINYNKTITGREIDNMYYSDVINGYYFIVLGSEHDNTSAYLSDTQLAWFEDEMEKAGQTGLPIFVLLHQSINGTHGLPLNWEAKPEEDPTKGGIGEQSDRVVEILKKYDNVFYISGHIHAGFKNADKKIGIPYSSVEYMENNNGNNITLINCPSFTNPDVQRLSHVANGCGWVVEVYENEVLLRARSFTAGTWLTKFDVTVPLAK